MFSANENVMLREHKRRVVNFVEETIPEDALDHGTTVMVMQTACRTPGCVPLETAIVIVFPRVPQKEWIEGLKESCGGTFKTKILLPLSEVTKEDVLDSLPPTFKGGTKTWERTCLQLRDIALGRIGGMIGIGDSETEIEERRLLAEYLRSALTDYLDRGCVAPELGEAFQKLEISKDDYHAEITNVSNNATQNGAEVIKGSMEGSGNFVIRRKAESIDSEGKSILGKKEHLNGKSSSNLKNSDSSSNRSLNNDSSSMESAMDWRRRQTMTTSLQLPSSDNILQRLSEREHAPGMRSPGCPCCEPDNIDTVLNNMMF